MKKIAVIGGGASGIIAACFAAQKGSEVILFERQKKLGRKLLVTGNGRCNISNSSISAEKYHGKNPLFVKNVFARFSLEETIQFFNSIGLPIIEEKNGRLFPASLQSQTVLSILEYELKRRDVTVHLHRRIDEIKVTGDRFTLITAGKDVHSCDSLILAAGSCAYPQLGASRAGYGLAQKLGHTVHDPFPAILPINIPLKILHRLQGIKWDCGISVALESRKIAESEGELLFTGFGLSGPAALDVSRSVNEGIISGKSPELYIDFFPDYNKDQLKALLDTLWMDKSKKLSFSLLGIMKQRMPEIILEIAGIDHTMRIGSLSSAQKRAVADSLKELRIKPGKPRGFDEAVVAAGGVDVDEIDPSSMESKLVNGLFITGELLDIDGDSGGYNLQFAWSTGALAGLSSNRHMS